MHWWKIILENIKVGDVLHTPGIGIDGGTRKRPFTINSIDASKIAILSGNAFIKLGKACFDVIEESFTNDRNLWLRCASVKSNPNGNKSQMTLNKIYDCKCYGNQYLIEK